MRIGFLGAGTWGFCLASLLGSKGYHVTLWTSNPEFAERLAKDHKHPKLLNFVANQNVSFTSDLKKQETNIPYPLLLQDIFYLFNNQKEEKAKRGEQGENYYNRDGIVIDSPKELLQKILTPNH